LTPHFFYDIFIVMNPKSCVIPGVFGENTKIIHHISVTDTPSMLRSMKNRGVIFYRAGKPIEETELPRWLGEDV